MKADMKKAASGFVGVVSSSRKERSHASKCAAESASNQVLIWLSNVLKDM